MAAHSFADASRPVIGGGPYAVDCDGLSVAGNDSGELVGDRFAGWNCHRGDVVAWAVFGAIMMRKGKLRMSVQGISNKFLWGMIPFVVLATLHPFASAHQTQISDGVGGTHHIEPNDTPRAGEPSQAWFALTQAGGAAIGLSDCDCELVLYGAGEEAIATPALTAIAVEGLTDVPGAELTFPQVGAYVLTLTGSPKGAADFSSFRLDFPVTVAAGKAIGEPAVSESAQAFSEIETGKTVQGEDVAQAAESEAAVTHRFPWLPIGLLGVGATCLMLFWRTKTH